MGHRIHSVAYRDPQTILIVDDDEINRGILDNIFADDYQVEEAENGRTGLEKILDTPEKYCAVLLDVMMPEMDGLETLRHLKHEELLDEIPVFLITAEANDAVMKEAYRMGVMDVISKPVIPYVVMRRINSVVELFRARRSLSNQVMAQQSELLRQAEQIIRLNRGMIEGLATAIEFRSAESGDHVRRIHDITRYMLKYTEWGEGMEDYDIEQIAQASIMHDIGKIAIPDAVLNKPGRLTPEEFEIMKTHTVQGEQLLEKIPELKENLAYEYAKDIARHHHERWDGRGYPDGLKGDEISPWAQIVSLADVYDALSCKRIYKDAFPREKVVEMIRDGSCGVFNPRLLDAFFSVEDEIAKMYDANGKEDAK
ncbi:Cyclic di-GMP phosphodiesterase response regulator RpfG [Eubacteriaceae bacterium CHKCI004]|nr:Cyclic di-GMP phosphodiesterase response regulator RpfG [Eubacteriaceae bacterium CHKCI004]